MPDGRTAHPRRASSGEERQHHNHQDGGVQTVNTMKRGYPPWIIGSLQVARPTYSPLRPSTLSPLSPLSPLSSVPAPSSRSASCTGQHPLLDTPASDLSPSSISDEVQDAGLLRKGSMASSNYGLFSGTTTTHDAHSVPSIPVPGMKNVLFPLQVPDLELPAPRSQYDQ